MEELLVYQKSLCSEKGNDNNMIHISPVCERGTISHIGYYNC